MQNKQSQQQACTNKNRQAKNNHEQENQPKPNSTAHPNTTRLRTTKPKHSFMYCRFGCNKNNTNNNNKQDKHTANNNPRQQNSPKQEAQPDIAKQKTYQTNNGSHALLRFESDVKKQQTQTHIPTTPQNKTTKQQKHKQGQATKQEHTEKHNTDIRTPSV